MDDINEEKKLSAFEKETIAIEREKLELEKQKVSMEKEGIQKNVAAYFWLMLFFWYWGIHKFYIQKFAMGVLYIFTGGFFSIGILIDIIKFASGKVVTGQGQYLDVSRGYRIFARILIVLYILAVIASIVFFYTSSTSEINAELTI